MCTSPLRAFYTGSKTDKGKDLLAVSKSFAGLNEVRYEIARKCCPEQFPLNFDYMYQDAAGYWQLYKFVDIPCGHCDECRQAYAASWAKRCMLECDHSENVWFVTLTYDKEHNDGSCHLRHFQLFMKRLRKRVGSGVRFFACQEYGERTHRPHCHAILFNCPLTLEKDTAREIRESWPYGNTVIGFVNSNRCAYVARYTAKKLMDWKPPEGFEQPRVMMSRRPGIGERWISEHLDKITETDRIYFAFSDTELSAKPFRYVDKLAEKRGHDLTDAKIRREVAAFRSAQRENAMRKTDDDGRLEARRTIAKLKARRRKERM